MLVLKRGNALMVAGSNHGSTAKRSAKDLGVAGSGPFELLFFFSLLFLYHV